MSTAFDQCNDYRNRASEKRGSQAADGHALGVITTAVEQYYENTSPKQFPLQVSNQSDFEIALFGNPPSDAVGIVGTGFPIPDADPLTDDPGTVFWRNASLYYFLNRTTQSRAIVESLSNQMLSNKYDGIATLIRIPNSSATATDCIRFVDAWGNTFNYRYLPGDAFPVVISAGPDKIFGTEDDVVGQ